MTKNGFPFRSMARTILDEAFDPTISSSSWLTQREILAGKLTTARLTCRRGTSSCRPVVTIWAN